MLHKATKHLTRILDGRVDKTHGVEHALAVVTHVNQAIHDLTTDQQLAVRLAALLHDADDRKYFPESKDLDNARSILNKLELSVDLIQLVLKMINLVSCSHNGNSYDGAEEEWMLYPRFADRLESLGEIGIVRCWLYTKHVNRPLHTTDTKRARTKEQIYKISSNERFQEYLSKKRSPTFIDHFYDKIFHIGNLGTHPYFVNESTRRISVMEDYILTYGLSGDVDEVYLEALSQEYLY